MFIFHMLTESIVITMHIMNSVFQQTNNTLYALVAFGIVFRDIMALHLMFPKLSWVPKLGLAFGAL